MSYFSQLENPQSAILEGFKRGERNGRNTLLNPAPADILKRRYPRIYGLATPEMKQNLPFSRRSL